MMKWLTPLNLTGNGSFDSTTVSITTGCKLTQQVNHPCITLASMRQEQYIGPYTNNNTVISSYSGKRFNLACHKGQLWHQLFLSFVARLTVQDANPLTLSCFVHGRVGTFV